MNRRMIIFKAVSPALGFGLTAEDQPTRWFLTRRQAVFAALNLIGGPAVPHTLRSYTRGSKAGLTVVEKTQ